MRARERRRRGRHTSELAGLGQTILDLAQSLDMKDSVDMSPVSCVEGGGEVQSVGANVSVCLGVCRILLIWYLHVTSKFTYTLAQKSILTPVALNKN